MVLDPDDKFLIEKGCRKFLPGIREIHRVKESPWSRVYHLLTADGILFCKAGPLRGAVTNEYKALCFLSAQGLWCVPEVLRYWEGKASAFLVTRFIQYSGHYDSARLGENWARVHSFRHRKDNCHSFAVGLISGMENELLDLRYFWGKAIPRRVRLFDQLDHILSKISFLYKKKKKFFLEEHARYIHRDARNAVIPFQNEMYLVDWHMAAYGDPAYDLARLCTYERQLGHFKETFMKASGGGKKMEAGHFNQEIFMKAYGGGKKMEESMVWRMGFYDIVSEVALLLYCFGDSANLVRYRASPVVVRLPEERLLSKLLDHKMGKSLQKIHSDFERLCA